MTNKISQQYTRHIEFYRKGFNSITILTENGEVHIYKKILQKPQNTSNTPKKRNYSIQDTSIKKLLSYINNFDIKGIKQYFKFAKQRKERGFDDSETWSLDYTIYCYILDYLNDKNPGDWLFQDRILKSVINYQLEDCYPEKENKFFTQEYQRKIERVYRNYIFEYFMDMYNKDRNSLIKIIKFIKPRFKEYVNISNELVPESIITLQIELLDLMDKICKGQDIKHSDWRKFYKFIYYLRSFWW